MDILRWYVGILGFLDHIHLKLLSLNSLDSNTKVKDFINPLGQWDTNLLMCFIEDDLQAIISIPLGYQHHKQLG